MIRKQCASGAAVAFTAGQVAVARAVGGNWRSVRPGNTRAQGDSNEAVWAALDGASFIGDSSPIFEGGGFAKFILSEERRSNDSNVDYPTTTCEGVSS